MLVVRIYFANKDFAQLKHRVGHGVVRKVARASEAFRNAPLPRPGKRSFVGNGFPFRLVVRVVTNNTVLAKIK